MPQISKRIKLYCWGSTMYRQNVPLLRMFFQHHPHPLPPSTPPPPSLSLCWGMPPRPSHLWVITFSRFRPDGWKSLCVLQEGKFGMHDRCMKIGHILCIFCCWVGVLAFFSAKTILPNSAHQVSVFCFFFFSPTHFALVIFSPSSLAQKLQCWNKKHVCTEAWVNLCRNH